MAESHSAGPALQGRGAFAQLRFQLEQPRVLVGRVPPADLVLDDPSVSRLHAEVSRSGSRFGVKDLGSVSGTFLNGDRVSEAPLMPGDLVRFGTVELVFEGPEEAATPEGQGTKRKRAFLAAGMTLVVIVVGGAVLASRVAPVPVPTEDPAELLRKTLGKCLGHSDPDSPNWTLALKACQEAVDLDPTHRDARALLKRARRELEMEALLKEALKAATSQEEDALLLLQKIDRDSSSFSKAAHKFREVQEVLFKRNKAQCLGDCGTGRFDEGIAACLRALQLSCNWPEGPDPETKRIFVNAARQTGRAKTFDCPPNPFQAVGIDKAEPRQMLVTPDPRVFLPLGKYLREGLPRIAAEQLKTLRASDPARGPGLAEMIVLLEVIEGRSVTWRGVVRERRAQEALALVTEVAEAEAKLLRPLLSHPSPPSRLLSEMQAETARLFLSLGREEASRGRPDLAFGHLEQGHRLDPANADLASLVARFEREAAARLASEQTCEVYRFVTSTTRPDTTLHQRAIELVRKARCPPAE